MLGYITIGANDVGRSGRFYAAVLGQLGYVMTEHADGIEFVAPVTSAPSPASPAVYVRKPFDGREATVGNGSMTAFQAPTHDVVRAVHAAGIEAGGTDEGAPGFRADYSAHFYVGYLRDPLGNKIAIFCADPAERLSLLGSAGPGAWPSRGAKAENR
jgi:hypothetical protein